MKLAVDNLGVNRQDVEFEDLEASSIAGYGPPLDAEGNPVLSNEEVTRLIIDHMLHGERLAKSFLRRWRMSLPSSYITSVVGLSLTEAANRFDPSRGVNFKTFFFYHLKGILVKEVRKEIDSERSIQYNCEDGSIPDHMFEETSDSWPVSAVDRYTPERLVQRRQLMRIVWKACSRLDELEQEVLLRHYIQEQSMTDIAKELGYSRCHISRVKSFALVKLEKAIRQLNIHSSSDEPDTEEEELPTMRPTIVDAVLKKKNYSGGRGRRNMPNKEAKFMSLVEYITDVMD